MKRLRGLLGGPERWIEILILVLVLIVLLLLILTLFFVPKDCLEFGSFLCYSLGVEDKRDVIQSLALALAGLVSALAVLAALRRATALNKTAQAQVETAQAQDKTAQAQADVVKATEKGHRQQRFRDAVDHLGKEHVSVRHGGAYALFYLALDEERLRASIAEILCAHIRGTTSTEAAYREEYANKPSIEIRSLLELLFTIKIHSEKTLKQFWKDLTPDLSEAYFRGVALDVTPYGGARFQGADLREAQFQGAKLWGAQFQGADLRVAQFQGAKLWGAQFQGAELWVAQFQGADLKGAQFQGADLRVAQFQGAYLEGAQFQGANLERAQFQGVFCGEHLSQTFEDRIKSRIGEDSDLSSVVFSGGLSEEGVERIIGSISEYIGKEYAQDLKEKLEKHVGSPEGHELPEDSGAETGHYKKEKAEQWIQEYNKNRDDDKNRSPAEI